MDGGDVVREAEALLEATPTVLADPLPTRLTPTQQRVMSELLGRRVDRPSFDADLGAALRAELEAGLAPAAALVPDGASITVSKNSLSQVLACEAHHVAEATTPFEWSAPTAKGTVAHKAIELLLNLKEQPPVPELVDRAMVRLMDDDRGPGAWITGADPDEVAELRADAVTHVAHLIDTLPPLKKEWQPRTETPLRASLCDDKVVLRGVPDLALGKAEGTRAQVLFIDFKTGRPRQAHVDDLRLYALLEALRCGVPPYRVASFYLDAGTWHAEDVTTAVLEAGIRRVVDGAVRIAELKLAGREPVLSPGPTCSFCIRRDSCAGAGSWDIQREQMGLDRWES